MIDTGPIVALADVDDDYHARATAFLHKTRARLLTSMAVITEAMYILEDDAAACAKLCRWVRSGGLRLMEPEAIDFARIAELLEDYADLPMDFADAVLIALCERLNITHVASVDRHFGIYRFKGRTKFTNVFLA